MPSVCSKFAPQWPDRERASIFEPCVRIVCYRSWLSACSAALRLAAEPPDFDRQVAPMLAGRCLDCHSGAEPKGGARLLSQAKLALATAEKAAPAIVVAGKPGPACSGSGSRRTRCRPSTRCRAEREGDPQGLDRRRREMGHRSHRPLSLLSHRPRRLRLVVAAAAGSAAEVPAIQNPKSRIQTGSTHFVLAKLGGQAPVALSHRRPPHAHPPALFRS